MDHAWEIFKEVHNETVAQYGFESHAFVLMNNHYHWNNSTPHENVDEGMAYFQTQTSKKILKAAATV